MQPALLNQLRQALQWRALALPVLSQTHARVLAASAEDESDLEQLVEIVTHDQSLAAHVLRVANSVHYAPREPILSLHQAIARMGIATLREISVAVVLKERVFRIPAFEARVRAMWRHSVATACYAREIARLLDASGDAAFLFGLLHDVGMPVALQVLCDVVGEREACSLPPSLVEETMLTFHCELGAQLAQRWSLGERIHAVIRDHHTYDAPAPSEDLRLVWLADSLAYLARGERSESTAGRSRISAQRLGLGRHVFDALLGLSESVSRKAEAFF